MNSLTVTGVPSLALDRSVIVPQVPSTSTKIYLTMDQLQAIKTEMEAKSVAELEDAAYGRRILHFVCHSILNLFSFFLYLYLYRSFCVFNIFFFFDVTRLFVLAGVL